MINIREIPHRHLGYLFKHKGEQMQIDNKYPYGKLPPLPERAITGLPNGWATPKGELFHTVQLWEFTNLYVLLRHDVWQILSNYLKESTLLVLSEQLKISPNILFNIRTNPQQTIAVPNLRKICLSVGLDLDIVERTSQAVRFNQNGKLEALSFPFSIDIYAWRLICHIIGDGYVYNYKRQTVYPKLAWSQLLKHQHYMRSLIKRLSRKPDGKSIYVYYPKALTYTIIGTMPGITIQDLNTPTFVQFVVDLPPSYKDWKVQFIAAFLLDDGSVSKTIAFSQKDRNTLELIMRLCDKLGYDHSPYPPKQKTRNVYYFQLRQAGVERFYIDLYNHFSRDPLLGLWHKQDKFQSLAPSFSLERGYQTRHAKEVCLTIIKILGDHQIRSTKELRNHPDLNPLLKGQCPRNFYRRLKYLFKKDFVREVKLEGTSKKEKSWMIPPSCDPEILIQEFHREYGYRSHPISRKHKSVTVAMVEETKAKLLGRGIKPTKKVTAREGGFSLTVLYVREDLRSLFVDDEDE